ncbi:MAG: hypothetical protein C3F02_01815 [Parcubacteria group bacterium]|nr:MAG: hypothetical protein C3F02_01815 [Parcubacteria group bacterium]
MQLIIDNSNYDNFLNTRFISGNFLQSSLWRKFLESQAKRYWQLVVSDGPQIAATCLFYQNTLPLGRSYFYVPKGPIFNPALSRPQKQEALSLILSKAREVTVDTRKREEIFLKLDLPENLDLPPELIKSEDLQPRDSWVLELKKSADELLAAMHPKTRYNISLAKRKGVSVEFSQDTEDLKHFISLIKKTAVRNQISVHSATYYNKLIQVLFKNKCGYLALAKVDNQVVAANIVLCFGNSATYLHGASDYRFRAYMAPHLLQWESIKKMQAAGHAVYDFWGVAPEDGSKPKWGGLSRFKKSFGGQVTKSPGAYNLIYDVGWYRWYKFARKLISLSGR